MTTGRWSDLSAENEIRYTGNGTNFVKAMSKASGVAKMLCVLVVRVSGAKIRQEFSSA